MDDILKSENYVEYLYDGGIFFMSLLQKFHVLLGSDWLPSTVCEQCIRHIIKTQFNQYKERLAKTDCKAEQRRLLMTGPPIFLSVRHQLTL